MESFLVGNLTARLLAVLLPLRDILPGFADPLFAWVEWRAGRHHANVDDLAPPWRRACLCAGLFRRVGNGEHCPQHAEQQERNPTQGEELTLLGRQLVEETLVLIGHD